MVKQQAVAVDQLAEGRTLDGRYRLDAEIGTGGLGVVYRATHEKLAKSVAVKLLHAHLGDDPLMRARFEREARALAALEHPNIVLVTDFGVEGDTPYLVMELLEGQTLADRLTQGALDEANARELALSLLSALAYVHAAGLVHRDVKPGNVFLHRLKEGGERLKLLDFGLAKFVLGEAPSDSALTRSGTVVGTPAYMSPEQASGQMADARSDVYAAGVLILELIAGRLPFGGDPIEQLRGHLLAEIPKLSELNTARVAHPEFDAFIRRALAKRPSDRFEDAKQMVIALEALPRPWFTRPSSVNADDHARTLVKAEALTVDMSTPAGEPAAAAVADPAPEVPAAPRKRRRPRRSLLARAWPLVFALVAGLGVWAYRTRRVAAPDAAQLEAATRALAAAVAPSVEPAPPPLATEPPAPEAEAQPAAESGEDTVRHAEPIESESDDVPAAAPPAAQPRPRVPARNPWSRGVPKDLRPVRSAAAKGGRGSDHMIAILRRYNREHTSDVRGHLLLASLYANRDWRADALTQFQIAYQLDPSSRGAPEMLPTLIGMVARGSSGAIRTIESVYRADALPAVNRALRAHRDDARAVARLTNLRTRLVNH